MRKNVLRGVVGGGLVLAVLAVGCAPDGGGGESSPSGRQAFGSGAPAVEDVLVPADAGIDQVNTLPRDPNRDPLPDDTLLAQRIRLGYRLIRNTPEYAPEYVGNKMSCSNCHMNAGQRERALPLVGIAGMFPVSRRREARLFSLEDRIRGCFMRSMNGTPPPYDSEELLAMSAYITWLSEGQPVGVSPSWRGRNKIPEDKRIPIEELDVERGEELYVAQCAMCHGMDGQGVDLNTAKPGPLWGPDSWNDGAGFARVYTLAGYLLHAMPLTAPGSLSYEDAQHIAAYIDSMERPEYPNKAEDYPGGAPIDAVYYPQYETHPLRSER